VVPTGATVTDDDRRLATLTHAAWTAFIKTGAPAAPGLPTWGSYEPARRATMILGYAPRMEADPLKAERLLWSDFFA
jgi:para-nitrobenzyl esterase